MTPYVVEPPAKPSMPAKVKMPVKRAVSGHYGYGTYMVADKAAGGKGETQPCHWDCRV
jgi:hypothetical protein